MKEMIQLANIPIDLLIDVAKKDGKTKEELKEEFRKLNQEHVHSIFGYRKFNDDFADSISIYDNGGVIGLTTFSYAEFISKLAKALNVDIGNKYKVTEEELNKKLHEGLEKFKEAIILGRAEVHNEFNDIYKDYQKAKEYYTALREEYKDKTKDDEYHDKEKYFYRCAMSPRFEKAMERQVDFYTRLVEKRQEYKELLMTDPQGAFIVDNFDVFKVGMLVIYGYIEACKTCDELKVIRRFQKIIESYIKSPMGHDAVVTLPNGEFIDYNTILQGYMLILKKIESMDIRVPFELLPKGEKEETENHDEETPTRKKTMTEEERLRLQALGQEKTKFYESTDYIARAKGTEAFNGYIAYFYPNGKVILDRKYEERYPSTAYGSASYHLKTRFFELLSGMDKMSLKKVPMVGKINHTDTWKERTMKIINAEGTQEDIDAGNALLDKLREQQEHRRTK